MAGMLKVWIIEPIFQLNLLKYGQTSKKVANKYAIPAKVSKLVIDCQKLRGGTFSLQKKLQNSLEKLFRPIER